MPQQHARRLLLLTACAAVLAGCAGPAAESHRQTPAAHQHADAATHQHADASAGPVAGSMTVKVRTSDGFRFRPGHVTVRRGRTVTFIVTNGGRLEHEFVIGDLAAQLQHEREMREMAGMRMRDEPNAVSVLPGETKRLTWTFAARGIVYYGCHVTGHYASGMRGTISVV